MRQKGENMTLIGRAELKKLLGVSTPTTDRYERRGVIPRAIRKPGMRPRWVLEEVLESLQQNK